MAVDPHTSAIIIASIVQQLNHTTLMLRIRAWPSMRLSARQYQDHLVSMQFRREGVKYIIQWEATMEYDY
jgi:hypothetical protein